MTSHDSEENKSLLDDIGLEEAHSRKLTPYHKHDCMKCGDCQKEKMKCQKHRWWSNVYNGCYHLFHIVLFFLLLGTTIIVYMIVYDWFPRYR